MKKTIQSVEKIYGAKGDVITTHIVDVPNGTSNDELIAYFIDRMGGRISVIGDADPAAEPELTLCRNQKNQLMVQPEVA